MSYRDEVDALRQRNEDLMRDLAEARERVALLEAQAKTNLAPVEKPAPLAKEPVRFGRIHFHRPRTYAPMLHLFAGSVRAALARVPKLGPLESESVVAWVGYHCLALPLTYVVRIPLYYASLCVALPVALLVCLVLSVPMMPIVLASRLTFSPVDPSDGTGWFDGVVSEDQGAMFLWMLESICLQPLLLTTTTLLHDERMGT